MRKYFDELKRSMDYLGSKHDTIFMGQAVEYAGTAMTNTLRDIDRGKLLEIPVNEDMQMGMANGLALNGYVPVSIFPRWNFLLLATNQIVNVGGTQEVSILEVAEFILENSLDKCFNLVNTKYFGFTKIM